MRVIDQFGWRYFVTDAAPAFAADKVGKWMYFYGDDKGEAVAAEMCRKAVENGVVAEAKYAPDSGSGVACFYLDGDDMAAHKRILTFFMENNLIRKTKSGRYYDISFKRDEQTLSGEYGSGFKGELKLSQFIDLHTGEWIAG